MVKVICAVLRYTEQQTSAIIEQEKFRQSVGFCSPHWIFIGMILFNLAMVEFNQIRIPHVIVKQFFSLISFFCF